MTRPLLEVIVTSAEDARAAEDGGADRLELVRDLRRGGLTPTMEVVERVLDEVRVPVRVMVRETEAHEVGSPTVAEALVAGARALGRLPIGGIVTGVLWGGTVDAGLLGRIVDAGGVPVTFHRAIEEVAAPEEAMTVLRQSPLIDRVLSSGGPGAWEERIARLERLAKAGAGQIAVIAGGGLTREDLVRLSASPIREVHVGRLARAGGAVDAPVSARQVEALVRALAG